MHLNAKIFSQKVWIEGQGISPHAATGMQPTVPKMGTAPNAAGPHPQRCACIACVEGLCTGHQSLGPPNSGMQRASPWNLGTAGVKGEAVGSALIAMPPTQTCSWSAP